MSKILLLLMKIELKQAMNDSADQSLGTYSMVSWIALQAPVTVNGNLEAQHTWKHLNLGIFISKWFLYAMFSSQWRTMDTFRECFIWPILEVCLREWIHFLLSNREVKLHL